MEKVRTLIIYPSLEIAMYEWDKAYAYVAKRFPVTSWIVRKGEILICDKYYVRFESALHEQAQRGFRGEIISENPDWKKVLDDIFEEAIVKNKEYQAVNVMVICHNESLHMILENFAKEIRDIFSDYDIWWGQNTIKVKGRHKIHFVYSGLLERESRDFDGVIFTDKSFQKYKDRIVEAMK